MLYLLPSITLIGTSSINTYYAVESTTAMGLPIKKTAA